MKLYKVVETLPELGSCEYNDDSGNRWIGSYSFAVKEADRLNKQARYVDAITGLVHGATYSVEVA